MCKHKYYCRQLSICFIKDAPNSADVWMLRHKVAELENNLADSTQQHGQEVS